MCFRKQFGHLERRLIVSSQKESQETNSSANARITLHDRILVEDTTLFRGNSTRTATYRGESCEEWSIKYFRGRS